MGSNNSRFNASGEEVPPKIHPLLLRRIEELRKHKNGGVEGQSSPEDETYIKVSPKETQPTKEQNMVRVDKLSKVVPLPVYEYGTEEQHNKHEDPSQEKVNDVENKAEVDLQCAWPRAENKHEEANTKHDDMAKHDDGGNDDDEEEMESDKRRLLGPGSPSFRIYIKPEKIIKEKECDDDEEEMESDKRRLLGPGSPSFRIYIKPEKIIKEKEYAGENSIQNICVSNQKNACESQAIVMHQKSPSIDSCQSAASQNSGSSNEAVEIESTTKRRGHKMKLGAVKKGLLNVKQNMVRVDKLSKVVPLAVFEYGTEEQHNKHEDPSQEKEKDVENKCEVDLQCAWPRAENKHEEANTKHDDMEKHDDGGNDDSEEDDDDEEIESDKRRPLGPGSPSFRIYIKPEKIIKEKEYAGENSIQNICVSNQKNACENQATVMHQKSPSIDSCQSAASQNSGSSNEAVEIETTTKRRGHKMKLGAVKKGLLNVKQVKHRMNPMFSCGGNDKNRTLY